MVKSILTGVLLFASCFSFSQDDIGRSSWITTPVKVDGSPVEWNQPLRYYDHNTKLFFAFNNDDKNLYICFQTADETSQMKIMRSGMEVTLVTKNKHKASITFPMKPQTETERPAQHADENSSPQNFNHANMRAAFLAADTTMDVQGFSTRNGLIPINDTSGINVAISVGEADKLTYEIAVPLKELFGAGYTTTDITKDISLAVKVNAGPSKNGSGGRNSFSGRGGGRMGGRRGGGGGMNSNSDPSAEEGNAEQRVEDRTAMFEKSEFKEKFVLAQSNTAK